MADPKRELGKKDTAKKAISKPKDKAKELETDPGSKEPEIDPIKAARAIIKKALTDKETKCNAAMQALLHEHDCHLTTDVVIRHGEVLKCNVVLKANE